MDDKKMSKIMPKTSPSKSIPNYSSPLARMIKKDPTITAAAAARKKAAIKKAGAEGPKKRTPVKKAAKKK